MLFVFFNDTATTEIYTLSLHDALPILPPSGSGSRSAARLKSSSIGVPSAAIRTLDGLMSRWRIPRDRKSTRLNSSHANISYAVLCLTENTDIRQVTTLSLPHCYSVIVP